MSTPQWGYDEANGPAKWGEYAPDALGSRQSPIVIRPADAVYDERLQQNVLRTQYKGMEDCSLINSGRSVQLDVPAAQCYLEGGPLDGKYELKQFHFHWGKMDSLGAEHVIDSKVYAAELHLVHWNCGKYAKFEDALKGPDGLSVLTVFIEPGTEHGGLAPLTKLMTDVRYAGDQQKLSASYNPSCLLPAETDKFWTYRGSLTTPPCFECVTFILFKQPIQISQQQLDAFRQLCSVSRDATTSGDTCSHQLVNNFRPPQPLNGRTVNASFRKFFT